MALRKYVPSRDAPSGGMKQLSILNKVQENAELADPVPKHKKEPDVSVDLTEVYFLIMHFLSSGPCQRTCGQLWNELLEHQLLPRRYHAWYSKSKQHSGDENDDGTSFPLNYSQLVERYHHVEKDHLLKLFKQLLLNNLATSEAKKGGEVPNAAYVPTLLGTGSFSLLSYDEDDGRVQEKHPPAHMHWPHMHADQVRGLSLREIGGGFTRHHRAPSIRAACYAIAKPSTMVQNMQNIKKLRGHRNAVYCAIFDRLGRYVVTGSDDRLVKIWSMETAFCLASCRGHEGDITDLAVSFNNAVVASASNDCVIRVWRVPDGMPVSVLRGHTAAVTAIAFCPRLGSLHQLLSSSDDGTCRLWDARASHSSPRIFVPRPSDTLAGKNGGPSTSNVPQNHHQIFCCAFNSSGTVFVTGSSDNLARVWNACKPSADDSNQPNHEIDILVGHENDVNYVQFSGCAVASRVSLTDSTKEESVPKFRNTWFSHDNIVTCSRDGSATIWTPKSRRSHGKAIRWIRLYHLRVPPPPMPPQPPRGPRQRILPTPRGVNMIVWSLDNRFVLAAIMDCRICVWNAADSSVVHTLTGHTQSTYVLDVHPFNPRIAMSAGYDGKTIVWDIWEGKPIQIYEISRFKLVDGKFSPDGTSIILSDDVGQLYVISTGQGECQKDAKYDQFFLGDYRPLIQDTFGNVLDQETQLMPYRRNMQDILCDSGMIPYEEPYQSMYQKRRLGALGMEWKPSSLKLAAGPDFSLDPDYQMLPLADLDFFVEPLPEFADAMDWEPEVEVRSDDTDSEYNVTEGYSSGGEHGSLNSGYSDDPECSPDDSEVEDKDGIRRSKRKKPKPETGILTSSGRRVKRRNLEECDGNSIRINRTRNLRIGRKSSKRKSSKSKALRPQRAAARNALNLFSKITGVVTDGEDEDGSESDLSETESSMLDSNIESDELDESQQKERYRHFKGKEVAAEESHDFVKIHALPEPPNGNRKRLILKLPVRDASKIVIRESSLHKDDHTVVQVGSSSKAPPEASDANGIHIGSHIREYYSGDATYSTVEDERGQTENIQLDLSKGYKNGEIRWGGVKARSLKRQRLGEAMSSAAYTRSTTSLGEHKETAGHLNELQLGQDHTSMSRTLEVQNDADIGHEVVMKDAGHWLGDITEVEDDVANAKQLDHAADQNDNPYVIKESAAPVPTRFRIKSRNISTDSLENQMSGGSDLLLDSPVEIKNKMAEHDMSNGHSLESKANGLKELDGQIEDSVPHLNGSTGPNALPKRMYSAVYRRSKLSRGRANSDGDGAPRESTSNASNLDLSSRGESNKGMMDQDGGSLVYKVPADGHDSPPDGDCKLQEEPESDDKFVNANNGFKSAQLQSEEWGSSSRMTVGLRSSRSRRTSYHFHDTPVDRKKFHQPAKGGSWLMLLMHEEGSRYIPQLGDEVAYLRQGHQEYLDYSPLKEVGPWKSVKGNIMAVEFCKVTRLEYSTLAGSGDSCCKMTLQFIDPISSVFQKSFKLTFPEVTGFPDFLVERSRYDVAMQRNWACRDKCKVWWKNEGEEDGDWWNGRIMSIEPKSPEFPDSPWERYSIWYSSDPKEKHKHSPWELFDIDDTQWEQPHIDDVTRNKLLSVLAKLERSADRSQDPYGVQKLRQVSQKSNFMNRFPVPLSLDVIQSRLENYYYRRPEAVRHDIEVMLSNAESYFAKNAESLTKMRRMSELFERTLTSL